MRRRRSNAARRPSRSNSGSWDRRAAGASPRSPACPATRTSTTPAPRRAACGSRPTAAKTFVPIFDRSAGRRRSARSPSRHPIPNIVWAGTGEAWAIRDSDVMGDGVYKSTDAGATWTHMGLDRDRPHRHASSSIRRIPNIVYVCALGRATGPQQERGVYQTTDGGKNWKRVLFVDPNTGCSGLTIDANESERAVRRHVAGRACTRGRCSAAARQRRLHHARRRRRHGRSSTTRAAEVAGRQDRRRDRAVELEARVRADPDRRSGIALALGRRRRRRGRSSAGIAR